MVQIIERDGVKWLKAKDVSKVLGYTQTQSLLRRIERTIDEFQTEQIAAFGRSKAAIKENHFLKFAKVIKPSLEGNDLDKMSELIEYVELDEKEGQSVVAKLDEANQVSQPPKSATKNTMTDLVKPKTFVASQPLADRTKPSVQPDKPVSTKSAKLDEDWVNVPFQSKFADNPPPPPTKPPIQPPVEIEKKEKVFWFDWLFGGVVELFYSRTFRFFTALNVILWQSCEYGELILEVWNLDYANTWAHIKAYGRAVGFETLILLLTMTNNQIEIEKDMDDDVKEAIDLKNRNNTVIKWVWLVVFCLFALVIGLCNVGVIENEIFRQIIITIPLPFSILATTHLFLVSKKK